MFVLNQDQTFYNCDSRLLFYLDKGLEVNSVPYIRVASGTQ